MIPQRAVPVAPFYIGAGALEHLRQPGRLHFALVLLQRIQLPQGPTGLKQRCAEARGKLSKRLTLCHRPRRGHTVEIEGWNEMRVHGVGRGRRQVQLPHLLAHIPRDELNGRLHFRNHAFRFFDALHAALTEPFVLGNGADGVDVLLEVPGKEFAVAAYAALQVDKVVGVADGADALRDRLALRGEALVFLASRVHFLLHLRQARCPLWGATWAGLLRLLVGVEQVLVHPLARFFRLGGRSLFGGHGGCDGFAQLMLHMEEVRRVMCPEVVGNIREQPRGFITGRLNHLAVETRKGWRHQLIPRVLIPCWGGVLQHNVVALGVYPHQAQTARQRFIQRHRHLFRRHLVRQTCAFFLAVRHHRFFNVAVDLLLRPIGRADKPIEARELQQQTHQANPTGTNLNTHHVECDDEPMQEGETGNTLEKRHDRGTGIEAVLVRAPRLQRTAGHVQPLGRLTLGDTLGVQLTIPCKQVRAFDARPALVTILIATLLVLDYRCHSYLPYRSLYHVR